MKENIILIGYMGVGKTEVGRALAAALGMDYLDTDSMIESEEKRSISDIFSNDGEEYFRNLETGILKKLSGTKGHVVATGGGMVLREENVKMLKAMGPLVLLKSSPEIIEKRLVRSKNRPLINVKDRGARIRQMLDKRNPIYDNVADFSVDTSELSVSDAVKTILGFYKGESK